MLIDDILSRLDGVKGRGGKYMARCPNHVDKTPSLSVSLGDDGRVLLKCFAGCPVEDIVWAMGLEMKDLFAEVTPSTAFPAYGAPGAKEKAAMEAEYIYAGGKLKKIKMRKPDGGKFCYWQHLDNGRWKKGRGDIQPGLYKSHADLPETFFLVEGEKDVGSLQRAGYPAVSLPDGAQSKWENAYDPLFEGKRILILPDNDEPGAKYAQMCAQKLYGNAKAVWILDLKQAWPDIPQKADISDMIAQFGADEAIQKVIALDKITPEWEPAPAAEDPFLSLFKPLTDFTEEEATWLIPGWIPEGQITLLASDGGVGKTSLWCTLVAALSAGRPCVLDPEGYRREPLKVAFCTTEDSVRKKLLKKLRQDGADMANIIAMDMASDKEGALRDFKFGSSEMARFIKYFKPALCVFDPVQGFIPPEINMGSRNAMRDCMAPLIALGEETGTTFLVVCHTNKRKGAYGRDRIADSADLWDIARSVLMAGYTESQGVRYLSDEKNNYARLQETVLFSINESGRIVKEGTTSKRDREFMLEAATAKSAPKKDDCREVILQALQSASDCCMKSDDLAKEVERYGYSYSTFRRARDELKRENAIDFYTTGSAKGKDRTWFTRLKITATESFQELPYDEPTPFDTPSA